MASSPSFDPYATRILEDLADDSDDERSNRNSCGQGSPNSGMDQWSIMGINHNQKGNNKFSSKRQNGTGNGNGMDENWSRSPTVWPPSSFEQQPGIYGRQPQQQPNFHNNDRRVLQLTSWPAANGLIGNNGATFHDPSSSAVYGGRVALPLQHQERSLDVISGNVTLSGSGALASTFRSANEGAMGLVQLARNLNLNGHLNDHQLPQQINSRLQPLPLINRNIGAVRLADSGLGYGRPRNVSLPDVNMHSPPNRSNNWSQQQQQQHSSQLPLRRIESQQQQRNHRNPYAPQAGLMGEYNGFNDNGNGDYVMHQPPQSPSTPTNPYVDFRSPSSMNNVGNGGRGGCGGGGGGEVGGRGNYYNHNGNNSQQLNQMHRMSTGYRGHGCMPSERGAIYRGLGHGGQGTRRLSDAQRQNSPLVHPPPAIDYFAQPNAPPIHVDPQPDLEIVNSVGELGPLAGQFNMPQGLCLGKDDEIVVADTLNHRIQFFERTGAFAFQWGCAGTLNGHLWHPRKVAYIPGTDHVVISDRVNGCSRIQIFERTGKFIRALGNLHGLRMALNTTTAGLTVYNKQIIIVEVQPSACSMLNEDGSVAHWFGLDDIMSEPSDVVVINQFFFISDFRDHCVCVFNSWGHLLGRIGGAPGSIVRYPRGLGISPSGLLLVVDTDMNRFHLSVWNPTNGELVSYHGIKDVKFSHSCGVIMNSTNQVITAVKKDHRVIMLQQTRGSPIITRLHDSRRDWNVNAPSFHSRCEELV
ncbi:putative Brain tumor protein [Hypsibius exemplaris]|uniref:Brain tumor protein n=1 Tax=Hypsibius exemplaris TaxID=2072580 RepID=A0A1W0WTB1_HYPEX|nr:putative Brain tumor protein [Hypsibius exemplaris]